MGSITFTIPETLYGYRQTTRKMLYSGTNIKYGEFKKDVLILAMAAGWKCKAIATKEAPPRLSVLVRWKKNPRIDWKNVYGGIEDALFEQDRHVKPGKMSDVEWDTGTEEAIVTVEFP